MIEANRTSILAKIQRWLGPLGLVLLGILILTAIQRVTIFGVSGWVNDDAMYATFARALAHGHGYVDTSTPFMETGLRYPILFPALLAAVCTGAHGALDELIRMQWVGPICGGLFVLLVGVYAVRVARLPYWLAIVLAGLIGFNSTLVNAGSLILSDLPTALLSMGVVLLLEWVLRKRPNSLAWGALAGVMLMLLCLMRYASATLLVAWLVVCLLERRWRSAAASLVGFVVSFSPWVVFRILHGGEEYHTTVGFLLGKDGGLLMKSASAIAGTFLGTTLPTMLVPGLVPTPTIGYLILGGLVAAVMLLGCLAGIRRPLPGQSALTPIYMLVTFALILLWMLRYVTTAGFATERLLMPVAPFALLAFGRGLYEIRSRYQALANKEFTAIAAALALVAFAYSGVHLAQTVDSEQLAANAEYQRIVYTDTFDFLRNDLPPDAHLLSLMSPAVHVNSGRYCYPLSPNVTVGQLLRILTGYKIQYLVGLPHELETPLWIDKNGTPFDASVLIVNDLVQHCPGLLEPVFFTARGHIGVFHLNQEKLRYYALHPVSPGAPLPAKGT